MKGIYDYLGLFKLELDPEFLMDRFILEHGSWEGHVIAYIKGVLRQGHVSVDIGANAGYHTLLMAHLVGPSGKVFAFEPNPQTRTKLLRNLQANPNLNDICEVRDTAVGKAAGFGHVHPDTRPNSIGNAGITIGEVSTSAHQVTIERLDELIDCRVDLIKIDVEGMELDVLEGASRLIDNYRPHIIVETLLNGDLNQNKAVLDFLTAKNYQVMAPDKNGKTLINVEHPHYLWEDCLAIPSAAT